ncbi:hypothetical protein FOCC_FOCC008664 [Frankliniella occidentalis]|nr:hypothetical protein FOCC_FOCC008664 [Frankliniella occidentalis]
MLADRECLAAPLVALAEQRQSLGWPTSCLAASLGEASERLGDLLHISSLEVLPSAISDQGAGADKDLSLSLTVDALAALSRADSQRSQLPRIVELTSLGQASHSSRENSNLFVLPPLSVLDPTSKSQLAGLAARLFSPVLVVETTPGDSVKVAAKAVVRAVLDRQPHGPYNLLGWRLSTVLALEVQRQLEAAGKRGVLFLVHGDVTRVQQWAEQRLGGDIVDGVRDGLVNGEAARAEEGAQVLDELLEAVAAHKSDVSRPFAGYVNIVRTSEYELQSLGQSDKDPHVKVQTLADRRLDSEALAAFINENAAWSQLAGEADLSLAISLASSSL